MNEQNTGNAFKILRLLYLSMLAGTVMFAVVIYLTAPGLETTFDEDGRNILVISLFIAAASLSVSALLWKKDIQRIQQENGSLSTKFDLYRAASIKRYALSEFAVMAALICYFITKEPRLYIVVAILLAHFLTLYPSPAKTSMHIGESAEDIENL